MPKPSISQVYFTNNKREATKIPPSSKTNRLQILAVAVIVVSGLASGYLLAQRRAGGESILPDGNANPKFVKSEKIVGTTAKEFKDSAEGILEAGGLDGEGTHKLIREGGPSQTAYLTSSIIDLSKYVGKKVKVWGETFKAQKAGWLMDVGRLEILE